MRISVKPIHTYKEFALDVNEGDSIAEVKQQIQNREGIPPERQCLIFPPSKLQNGRTLSSYNIPAESTVLLVWPDSSRGACLKSMCGRRRAKVMYSRWI